MITEEEFNNIYNEYHPKVYRLCLGYMSGNQPLADDIAQEVFIKLWEKQNSIKDKRAITSWIYRVSFNTCMMSIRNNKKYSSDEIEDTSYQPEKEQDSSESLKQLYQIIDKLKSDEKNMALLLLEGVDTENIAEVLGITKINARVKIHRLRSKLKNEMEQS